MPVKSPFKTPAHRTLQTLLESEDTFGSVLVILCADRWTLQGENDEPSFLHWAPETLRTELEHEFHAVVPDRNFDKLMAAIAVLTDASVFQHTKRFIAVANALGGSGFDPTAFDPADSVECAWAVTEMLLLWPAEEDTPHPFSDEVRTYIGEVLKDEGYVYPPDILKFALGGDFREHVHYNFHDNPQLLAEVALHQHAKLKDVETVLRDNLHELARQLAELPLVHGSTEQLTQSMLHMLQRVFPPETS